MGQDQVIKPHKESHQLSSTSPSVVPVAPAGDIRREFLLDEGLISTINHMSVDTSLNRSLSRGEFSEKMVIIQERLIAALTIAGAERTVLSVINALTNPTLEKPRLRFEPVHSLRDTVTRFGIHHWKGDCFLSVVIPMNKETGEKCLDKLEATIYFEPKLLADVAKAVVAIHHELHHITRYLSGKNSSEHNREEVETFSASINGLKFIERALRALVQRASEPDKSVSCAFLERVSLGRENDRAVLKEYERAVKSGQTTPNFFLALKP